MVYLAKRLGLFSDVGSSCDNSVGDGITRNEVKNILLRQEERAGHTHHKRESNTSSRTQVFNPACEWFLKAMDDDGRP